MIDLSHPPAGNNTWAVIVLFHPPPDFSALLAAVSRQAAGTVVVSNDGLLPVGVTGALNSPVVCIVNRENRGLATALNQGIDVARHRQAKWILLLDQDTRIDDDMVSGLAEAWRSAQSHRIAIVAANYRSRSGGRVAYQSGARCQIVPCVVTSGSLLAVPAIDLCGGMKEDFFIEGIDIEFCLRIRRSDLLVIASGRPLMTHGAGDDQLRYSLGRRVLVSHHPPWRVYLQFRNLIWIIVRYARFDWRWASASLVSIVKRIILILAYEDSKLEKLRAAQSGLVDGLYARLGVPACEFMPRIRGALERLI